MLKFSLELLEKFNRMLIELKLIMQTYQMVLVPPKKNKKNKKKKYKKLGSYIHHIVTKFPIQSLVFNLRNVLVININPQEKQLWWDFHDFKKHLSDLRAKADNNWDNSSEIIAAISFSSTVKYPLFNCSIEVFNGIKLLNSAIRNFNIFTFTHRSSGQLNFET